MLPACLPLPGLSLTQGRAVHTVGAQQVLWKGCKRPPGPAEGRASGEGPRVLAPLGRANPCSGQMSRSHWDGSLINLVHDTGAPLTSGVCPSGQAGPELWRRPKLGAPVRPGPGPHLKFSSTFPRQALVLGVGGTTCVPPGPFPCGHGVLWESPGLVLGPGSS